MSISLDRKIQCITTASNIIGGPRTVPGSMENAGVIVLDVIIINDCNPMKVCSFEEYESLCHCVKVALCVPVVDRKGVVRGAIQINFPEVKLIKTEDEKLAQFYAQLAVVALDNEEPTEPLKEYQALTLRLGTIRSIMHRTTDAEALKVLLLKHVRQLTNARFASFFMLKEGGAGDCSTTCDKMTIELNNEADLDDANNIKALVHEVDISITDSSVVGAVMLRKISSNISVNTIKTSTIQSSNTHMPWYQLDPTAYAQYQEEELGHAIPGEGKAAAGIDYDDQRGIETTLVVPLAVRGRTAGALQVSDKLRDSRNVTKPRYFTAFDEEILDSLGHLTVALLDNLHLASQLQDKTSDVAGADTATVS